MKKDYIHWEDFYKSDFLPTYNDAKVIYSAFCTTNNSMEQIFLNNMQRLYYTSCKLIQYYLYNNGQFPLSLRRTIKNAFYLNLLKEGDVWIQLGDIIYSKTDLKLSFVMKFLKDNFYIFGKLKEKFDSMLVEECKIR